MTSSGNLTPYPRAKCGTLIAMPEYTLRVLKNFYLIWTFSYNIYLISQMILIDCPVLYGYFLHFQCIQCFTVSYVSIMTSSTFFSYETKYLISIWKDDLKIKVDSKAQDKCLTSYKKLRIRCILFCNWHLKLTYFCWFRSRNKLS